MKKDEAFLQEADALLTEALDKAGGDIIGESHHQHPHHHDH